MIHIRIASDQDDINILPAPLGEFCFGMVKRVVASLPTQEFDAKWGNDFLKPSDFAALRYQDLARK